MGNKSRENTAKPILTGKSGKWKCLLLCVVMCLLSGCGKQEKTQGETTELFSTYTVSQSGVLKSDGLGYLHFFDKESGQVVYLCNRGGCLHRDSTCSAYAEALLTAFFAEDQLYYFQVEAEERIKITKANRYGENRQVIGYVQGIPLVADMNIAEEKLYFNCILYDKEKETSYYQCYAMDPESGEIAELPMPEIENEIGGMADFAVTDSYYYYTYALSDMNLNDYMNQDTGELSDVPWDEMQYTYRLYRINRENGEETVLLEEQVSAERSFAQEILEADDKQILIYWGQQILWYDPLTGEKQVCYGEEGQENSWSIKQAGEYYILLELDGSGNYHVLRDWQEVGSFSGKMGTCLGACGGTVYFEGDGKLYYMDYEQIETGNYELSELEM
ncbi:MAG: hypothetical protein ACI4SE_07605 [Lachnospiraceae bacterium]